MVIHKLHQLSQVWPPKPSFTEEHLPDLKDKVYLVTGANTGVGRELAHILYSKNARVYVAARSQEKAEAAIESIRKAFPESTGSLEFLSLDLADLTTVKSSAQQFLDREPKLHVLFNNAGVMDPPKGSITKQGYELQLGVNNLGPQLFTKLLTPRLAETAKSEPADTVRVVWVASSGAEMPSVPNGGVDMTTIGDWTKFEPIRCYFASKALNVLQAQEYARRHRDDGIVSVALNPGNLDSELWRQRSAISHKFLRLTILHPAKYGAYTELFAGLSPKVTMERTGGWIVPWGRFLQLRPDLVKAAKSREEGGYGTARAFFEWAEEQTSKYE